MYREWKRETEADEENVGRLCVTTAATRPHSEEKKNDVTIWQEILYRAVVCAEEIPTKKPEYS